MYEMILDEIEARRANLKTATLGELATLGNTTGRYGGLGAAEDEKVVHIGQLHIDALRAPRRIEATTRTEESPLGDG